MARFVVKPRLSRSSWRPFASTHLLMLAPTSSRETLFACPSYLPWNLPSFTVESSLSSPCSRSDPPLSRHGAAIAHRDSLSLHDLVIWTDASVPFPISKGGSGVLANCSLRGTEVALSFLHAQYAEVFPLKPAPFCKSRLVSAGLGSTNKSAIFHVFSSSLILTLSSPPYPLFHLSFYFNLSIWQELSFLSSCTIRLQWVPRH